MKTIENDRDETIRLIKTALNRRSGRVWSVTGGRGTAWGWIKIDAPPSRRTWGSRLKAGCECRPENYEYYDTGTPDRNMSPADREELGRLLGLDRPARRDGEGVAASSEYRREYIERATGKPVTHVAQPYWD